MEEQTDKSISTLKRDLDSVTDYYSTASRASGALGYGIGNSSQRTFSGHDRHISVRSETTRADYDEFRPAERIPTDYHEATAMCMRAYERVGIIYRVINLLADFVTCGIRLEHPIESKQRLYRSWWDRVRGPFVSERMVNYAMRCGNVYCHRGYSKVPVTVVQDMKSKANYNASPITVKSRIPTDYTFLNPLSVDVVGKELSTFVKKPVFVLEVNSFLRNLYSEIKTAAVNDKDALVQSLLKQIPKDVRRAIEDGARYVAIPNEDIYACHYKKDDWSPLAYPMTYAVLDNILDLEKMHLADRSALDGAISNIRLWKLGIVDLKNPSNSVIPKKAAYQKLRDTLENNVMGGVIDIIWGPELDFKESSTSVHHFLGPEKYEQVMYEIYEGLGVPATLTGRGGSGASYNNNYLSMKAMVSTLQYLRNILTEFWQHEVNIVSKALDISPAQVNYDNINFGDESVVNKLIMDMVDRDIVSAETALEHFDFIPEVERKKIIKQQKMRESGKMPTKYGPYSSDKDHELKKIFSQRGVVTPSEVGVNLEDRKQGEESFVDMQNKGKPGPNDNNSETVGRPGRPPGAKDNEKRRRNSLVVNAQQVVWGIAAQDKIHDLMCPVILSSFGVDNCRQMTNEQRVTFEKAKLAVFSQLPSMTDVTKEAVYKILRDNPEINPELNRLITENVQAYTVDSGLPTSEVLKHINSISHASLT